MKLLLSAEGAESGQSFFSKMSNYLFKENLLLTIILAVILVIIIALVIAIIAVSASAKKAKKRAQEAAETNPAEEQADAPAAKPTPVMESAPAEEELESVKEEKPVEKPEPKQAEKKPAAKAEPKTTAKPTPAKAESKPAEKKTAAKTEQKLAEKKNAPAKAAPKPTAKAQPKAAAKPAETPVELPFTSGKWVFMRDEDDETAYLFELYASNGELMLRSSKSYASLSSAKKGLETYKTNIRNGNFRVTRTKSGDYIFQLFNASNMLLAYSADYSSRTSCESAIESTKRFSESAAIEIRK